MQNPPICAFAAAFTAAWAAVAWWPVERERQQWGSPGPSEVEPLPLVAEGPESKALGSDGADGQQCTAVLALAGLTGSPDLDAVFASVGSIRWLRLGLFLRSADSAAITALLARQSEEESLTEAELEMVWQQWVETDVQAAVAWNEGNSGVWRAWARIDPKAALAAAGENAQRLGLVIRSIGQKDMAWAARLMARYPQVDPALGWAGAAEEMSTKDPAGAASLAMQKGAGWENQIASWAGRDPAAALAWAQQISQPALKRLAAAEVIRAWTRADPAAGLRTALELPSGRTTSKLVSGAVEALAHTDEEAARKAVAALPAGSQGTAARMALAATLAGNDPSGALEALRGLSWQEYDAQESPRRVWWEGGIRDNIEGGLGGAVAEAVVKKLAESRPRELVNLLAEQQAAEPQAPVPLYLGLWAWLHRFPEEASSWLRDQPAGDVRDSGIDTMIQYLGKTGPAKDFEAALQWAASAGESKRAELMETALSQWREADFEAAAAAGTRYGIKPDPAEPEEEHEGLTILKKGL